MKGLMFGVVLLFGLFSSVAEAGAARCEGCTESQFRAKARTLGAGQHVISSFSTDQIKIYSVSVVPSGEPGVPDIRVPIPVEVPEDIQALFDDAFRFYGLTGGTMKAAVTVKGADLGVSGMGGATAYDVMTDVNLRGRLGDRLATGTLPGWSQLDRVGEQVTKGAFSMIGAGDASIEITVEMSDGSTVVYKLSVESGTGQYLEGRSRTKDGQVIPDKNAPEYQGTWTGDEDIGDLKEYLEGLGAKFAQVGTGTIMESMTCTWVPPTLNCVVEVTRL